MGLALYQGGTRQQGEIASRRCLIVERSLVRNRGHHYTQVAAIASLLPQHQLSILAGPGYDCSLPYPALTMTSDVARIEYLTRKAASGSLRQKFTAIADIFLSRRTWPLPRSGYGADLASAILKLSLDPSDLVVVPSASLDDLASVVDAANKLGHDRMPRVQMRFLEPSLGEPKDLLRDKRMAGLLRVLPSQIELACETEELAHWLSDRFGRPFKGGAYLPCTIDPRSDDVCPPRRRDKPLRVGVFGAPKKRKGSARILPIIAALRQRDIDAEIVVQGEARDFEPGGIFFVADECESKRIKVISMLGGIAADTFRDALCSVDAVLLPYDTSVYGLQGSGIVQDAVAALRPVVCSRGFSMCYLLRHGNALEAVTDEDFAGAIESLIQHEDTISEGCLKAREAFRTRLHHPVLFQDVNVSSEKV